MSVNDYMVNNVKALIIGFGWVDLGPQKNPVMFSFRKEETEERLNLYYTTMTITIQEKKSSRPQTFRHCTIDDVESILQTGDIGARKLF